jgi:hypothetical protein
VSIVKIVERQLERGLGHKWLEMPVDIDDMWAYSLATLNGNLRDSGVTSDSLATRLAVAACLLPLGSGEGREFAWGFVRHASHQENGMRLPAHALSARWGRTLKCRA